MGNIARLKWTEINWDFFKKLVQLQETEGLHAANKLSLSHIRFKTEVMKMRLAAQIFADALDFCNKDLHLEEFVGSNSTARFFRTINNIFVAVNSQNLLSKSQYARP